MAHQVVVICSPQDMPFYRQLEMALAVARRNGLIVLRNTAALVDDAALTSSIDDADIVLVILTPALVNSTLWTGAALQRAKATFDLHRIPVVPIIAQQCDWEQSWLGKFASLPRSRKPLSEWSDGLAGWAEVAAELRSVFTRRAPRVRDITRTEGHDADAKAAIAPADLSGIRDAYRRIEQYHEALLGLVDAAARAAEAIIGPLPSRSWTPGELHYPGRPASPRREAFPGPIPLRRVSYVWTSTSSLQKGACRVILVHDGDGAGGLPREGAGEPQVAPHPTLSTFATCVVDEREERSGTPSGWERADSGIVSAPGFSPNQWEDGEVHVAEARDFTLRFGGFSEDMAQILSSPSREPWLTRLRALISGVKGG